MPVLYQRHPSMFRNRPILFLVLIAGPIVLLRQDDSRLRGFGALMIPISVLSLLAWWLRCRAVTLTVTDRDVSLRRGLLSRDVNEVPIRGVRNIRVRQGMLQRLLGVGYLGISSAGQSDVEIEVHGIPAPGTVKRIVGQQKESAKADRDWD